MALSEMSDKLWDLYPAIENIPQQPSADFPDQTNPEKYLNNDQETLEKVVNTPLFYNDPQAYFRINIVSDISTWNVSINLSCHLLENIKK